MDLIEAIMTRRTIHTFRADPVPDSVIERMLDAAVQAPNHHVTEPWRFVVIQENALRTLAACRYQTALDKALRLNRPQAERVAAKARQDYLAVSTVIAVIQILDDNPGRREEDYAAISCATYAMMLAGWNFGVGSYWATGGLTQNPEARSLCKAGDNERIVGFIRLGYPQTVPQVPRIPATEKTQWLN